MQLDSFRIYPEPGGVWHYAADPDIGIKVQQGVGRSSEQAVQIAHEQTTLVIVLHEDGQAGQRSVTTDSEATIVELREAIELLQAMLSAHEAVQA
ncbi:hypothetical protein ASF05_12210 [Aeromicrobium sp. Leaf245]|nr:hypothetical protein ASF05_12210 [Aeromicrobium sp. Leaf245]